MVVGESGSLARRDGLSSCRESLGRLSLHLAGGTPPDPQKAAVYLVRPQFVGDAVEAAGLDSFASGQRFETCEA